MDDKEAYKKCLAFQKVIHGLYIDGYRKNVLNDFITTNEPFNGIITCTYIPKNLQQKKYNKQSHIFACLDMKDFVKANPIINPELQVAIASYKKLKKDNKKVYLIIFEYITNEQTKECVRTFILWKPEW